MVEDAELARMAGSEARHQGMVAQVRAYRYADLEELLSARPDPLLVVDGVTDPRNLGAILRSAEGAGLAGRNPGARPHRRDHAGGDQNLGRRLDPSAHRAMRQRGANVEAA